MNQRYAAIRFVGGPWHNRIVEVRLLPHIRVPKPLPALVDFADMGDGILGSFETETYFLCRFYTGWNKRQPTIFTQYIHESLMRGRDAARDVDAENEFPKMPKRYWFAFLDRLLVIIRSRWLEFGSIG